MPEKTNNPWDELDIPRGGELSVGEVNSAYWKFAKSRERGQIWDHDDVRAILKKETGTGELVLRGPAQVVKGEEPIVGVTLDLGHALEILFDVDSINLRGQTWLADVENTAKEGKIVTAKLKNIYEVRSKTPNHIIISKGLAEQLGMGGVLGIGGGGEVKIVGASADVENLDLDSWR